MSYVQSTKPSRWDKSDSRIQPETLPVTKLRFTGNQLNNLNHIFNKKLTENENNNKFDVTATRTEEIVERLIQRLLCAVGSYDSRFSSTFLLTLHDKNTNETSSSMEYIVRLDALSIPTIFQNEDKPNLEILECNTDGPSSGFAKIRLRNKTSTKWAEFINSSGYLRRDKLQERFVELLAIAAASAIPSTVLEVEESTSCGVPGKIIDACTLVYILRIPPEERLYFGPAVNNLKFPDPRDFRLAILDDPTGVKVRVGFLAPSPGRRDVEVTLLLGIAMEFWPQNTDFPYRVSIEHADCLLYHQSSEMGLYLVCSGSQSTNWQISLPATEVVLHNYYEINSPVSLILKILYMIMEDIHCNVTEDTCKFPQKLLTKRAIREVFWRLLENDVSTPLVVLQNWTSTNIAKHVLQILDKIIGHLRQIFLPSYFFPNCNLLSQPSYIYEEDYLIEANRLHMYIARLFDESLRPILDDDNYKKLKSHQNMEEALIRKWSDFVSNMLPPKSTRSNRFSFTNSSNCESSYTHYTSRQIDYISLLLKSMLNVKQYSLQICGSDDTIFNISPENPKEDIIYLLVTMIERAKQHIPQNKGSKLSKIRNKIDVATAKLVETIRKDKQISNLDLSDDTILVKTVLKWLYKGLDQSKNCLGLILRPYLNKIFRTSHENSWHLEIVKKIEMQEELKSLGVFCRLVNENKITPASGLIEAVNKGWIWSRNMLDLVRKAHLRVVFIPERGNCNRHILSLPSYDNKGNCNEENLGKRTDISRKMYTLQEKRKFQDFKVATLPARNFFRYLENDESSTHNNKKENNLCHDELKKSSSLNQLLKNMHRFGVHRCPGDITKSLMSLQKISILQEVSNFLPPLERQEMLNKIQKISKETKRQIIKRRNTLPPLRNTSKRPENSGRKSSCPQIYKPTSEEVESEISQNTSGPSTQINNEKHLMKLDKRGTCKNLLETCRTARLKEDCKIIVHENIKIKSLFKFDDVN